MKCLRQLMQSTSVCLLLSISLIGCDDSSVYEEAPTTLLTVDGIDIDATNACMGLPIATLTAIQPATEDNPLATQVCEVQGSVTSHVQLPAINSDYNIQWIIAGDLVIAGEAASFAIEDNYILKAKPAGRIVIRDGADFELGLGGIITRGNSFPGDRDNDIGLRIEPLQAGDTWNGLHFENTTDASLIEMQSVALINASLHLNQVKTGGQLKAFEQIQIINPSSVGIHITDSDVSLEDLLVVGAQQQAMLITGPAYPKVKKLFVQSLASTAIHILPGAVMKQTTASTEIANKAQTGIDRPLFVNATILGNNGIKDEFVKASAILSELATGFYLFNSTISGYENCLQVVENGNEGNALLRNVALACSQAIAKADSNPALSALVEANHGVYAIDVDDNNQTIDALLIPSLNVQNQNYFPILLGEDELSGLSPDDSFFGGGFDGVLFIGFAVEETDVGKQINLGFTAYSADPSQRWYTSKGKIANPVTLNLPVTPICNHLGSLSSAQIVIDDIPRRVCVVNDNIEQQTDIGLQFTRENLPYTLDDGSEAAQQPVVWLISHNLQVGSHSQIEATEKTTMILQPGAELRFFSSGGITVNRGGLINAEGTAEQPIRLASFDKGFTLASGTILATGAQDEDGRDVVEAIFTPEWLGLVINGNARNNHCPDAMAESGICDLVDGDNVHGGYDALSSSGSISHLQVLEANVGLTLNSVGAATQLTNITALYNKNLGIEINGGSVVIEASVISENVGGGILWHNGYNGVIANTTIQYSDTDFGALDSDDNKFTVFDKITRPLVIGRNNSNDPALQPISNPLLANVSMAMVKSRVPFDERERLGNTGAQVGLLLENGSSVNIYNSLISTADACLSIVGDVTLSNLNVMQAVFQNVLMQCNYQSESAVDTNSQDTSDSFLASLSVFNLQFNPEDRVVEIDKNVSVYTKNGLTNAGLYQPSIYLSNLAPEITTELAKLDAAALKVDSYQSLAYEVKETLYFGATFYEKSLLNTLCSNDEALQPCTDDDVKNGSRCDISFLPQCSLENILDSTCINRLSSGSDNTLASFFPINAEFANLTTAKLLEAYALCSEEEIANYNPTSGVVEGSERACIIPADASIPQAEATGMSYTISPFILANYEKHYYDAQSAQCTPKVPLCSADTAEPCYSTDASGTPLSYSVTETLTLTNCTLADAGQMCVVFDDDSSQPAQIRVDTETFFDYNLPSDYEPLCREGGDYPCIELFPEDNVFAQVFLSEGNAVPTCKEATSDQVQCATLEKQGLTYQPQVIFTDGIEILNCDKTSNSGVACMQTTGAAATLLSLNLLNQLSVCSDGGATPCFSTEVNEGFTDRNIFINTGTDNVFLKDYAATQGINLQEIPFDFLVCDDAASSPPCVLLTGGNVSTVKLTDAAELSVCMAGSTADCINTAQLSDFTDLNILVTEAGVQMLLKQYAEKNAIDYGEPTPPITLTNCDLVETGVPCYQIDAFTGTDLAHLELNFMREYRQIPLCRSTTPATTLCFTTTVTDISEGLTDTNSFIREPDTGVEITVKKFAFNKKINLQPVSEVIPIASNIFCEPTCGAKTAGSANLAGLLLTEDPQYQFLTCGADDDDLYCIEDTGEGKTTTLNVLIKDTTVIPNKVSVLADFVAEQGITLSLVPVPDPIRTCENQYQDFPCVWELDNELALTGFMDDNIPLCVAGDTSLCYRYVPTATTETGFNDLNIFIDKDGDNLQIEDTLRNYAASNLINLSRERLEPPTFIRECAGNLTKNYPCVLEDNQLALYETSADTISLCDEISSGFCFYALMDENYDDLSIFLVDGDEQQVLREYAQEVGVDLSRPSTPDEPAVEIAECNADNSNYPCMNTDAFPEFLNAFIYGPDALTEMISVCSDVKAVDCYRTDASDNFTDLNVFIVTAMGDITLREYSDSEGISLIL
ncbi:MAG: hypothetical protein AAGB12_02255 [Pseudomonadota bacterium]